MQLKLCHDTNTKQAMVTEYLIAVFVWNIVIFLYLSKKILNVNQNIFEKPKAGIRLIECFYLLTTALQQKVCHQIKMVTPKLKKHLTKYLMWNLLSENTLS